MGSLYKGGNSAPDLVPSQVIWKSSNCPQIAQQEEPAIPLVNFSNSWFCKKEKKLTWSNPTCRFAVLEAKNLNRKHKACCVPHLRQKCMNAMKFDKSYIKKRVVVLKFQPSIQFMYSFPFLTICVSPGKEIITLTCEKLENRKAWDFF